MRLEIHVIIYCVNYTTLNYSLVGKSKNIHISIIRLIDYSQTKSSTSRLKS